MEWLFRPIKDRTAARLPIRSLLSSMEALLVTPSKHVGLTFHPIHDMESLWWLAVWSLTRHTVDSVPMGAIQRGYYLELFQIPDWAPYFAFLGQTMEENPNTWTTSLPSSFESVALVMLLLAQSIKDAHANYQRKLPRTVNPDVYDDDQLPQMMVELFEIAQEHTAEAFHVLNSSPTFTRSAEEIGRRYAQQWAWAFAPLLLSSPRPATRGSQQDGGSRG